MSMPESLSQSPYARGARAAIEGMKLALRNKDIGRAYLRAAAVLFALTILLDIGTIWTLFHFTTAASDAQMWQVIVFWLARVIGTIALLLVGPVLAIFIINIAMPLFNKELFLAGLRAVDPARAAVLEAKPGMPLSRAITIPLWRMCKFLLISVVLFMVSLIPVIGVAATLLQLWFTARSIGWELMDPYFECLDIRYAEQKLYIERLQKPLLGFGFPISLMLAMPIVGPLFFGLAQAAAATFVAREVPVDPRETAA